MPSSRRATLEQVVERRRASCPTSRLDGFAEAQAGFPLWRRLVLMTRGRFTGCSICRLARKKQSGTSLSSLIGLQDGGSQPSHNALMTNGIKIELKRLVGCPVRAVEGCSLGQNCWLIYRGSRSTRRPRSPLHCDLQPGYQLSVVAPTTSNTLPPQWRTVHTTSIFGLPN